LSFLLLFSGCFGSRESASVRFDLHLQVWRHQVSRPDILHLVPALLACARFPFRPRSGCRLLNGPSFDGLPGRHPLAKQAELQRKISPRQERRKTTKEETEEKGKKIGNRVKKM
jgi:hypothetical protein